MSNNVPTETHTIEIKGKPGTYTVLKHHVAKCEYTVRDAEGNTFRVKWADVVQGSAQPITKCED